MRILVRPRDALLGLSRIITPVGRPEPLMFSCSISVSKNRVSPLLCISRRLTVTWAGKIVCCQLCPLLRDKSHSTCEPKLCVSNTPDGGGGKLWVKRLWLTLLMIMPCAYKACHWCGLIYWPLSGGRFGLGSGIGGASQTSSTCAGPSAGVQFAPPSRLTSGKISKKLPMRNCPSAVGDTAVAPNE